MKSSMYNVYLPAKNGDYLLFNTMRGSNQIIDRELKDTLENNSIRNISPDYISKLKELGFIVDEDLDEKRIYAFHHNMAKYSSNVSSFLVFPTYSCNLSCSYCYEKGVGVPREKSMGRNDASLAVDFIKNMAHENHSRAIVLGLYGGEPLLKADICLEVSEAISNWSKEKNMAYFGTLTTNGTLLSEKIYEELYPFISSIHFTLDGPCEKHNKTRSFADGRGTYDYVMKAVSLVGESDRHMTIRINIDGEECEDDLKIVLGDLANLGLKDRPKTYLYFMHLAPADACINFPDTEEYAGKKQKYLEQKTKFWSLAKKLGWGKTLHVDAGQEHSILSYNILSCGFLKKGCYVIDPFADLYLCPSIAGMKEYSVGTINAGGLPDWNDSYYGMITRNPINIEPCGDCKLLPLCGGGCPVNVHRKFSTYKGSYCGHLKDLYEKKLQSYFKYKFPEKFEGMY